MSARAPLPFALPTPHEVVGLYEELQAFWDVRPFEVRDPVVLEMVCARPFFVAGADVLEATGLLVEGLLNNRPFSQLNHATALAVLQAALQLNGYRLACSPAKVTEAFDTWTRPLPVDGSVVAKWLRLAAEPI